MPASKRARALRLGLAVVTAAAAAIAGAASLPAQAMAAQPAPITISGLDLHDGMILRHADVFYLYGTRYGCGFRWTVRNTPFCGFGVATAPSLSGPWTFRDLLFSPADLDNWGPDRGRTWDWVCGSTGAGCFNPRMVQRPDGVWLLWFNAPRDSFAYHVPAYYVMGCRGPLGPCGYQAGGLHGSTHKPDLKVCHDDGDFSIITSGTSAAIICSEYTLAEEKLDHWWTDGTGTGTIGLAGTRGPAAVSAAAAATAAIGEGVGAYQVSTGGWEMVYSTPECGYCTGPPRKQSVAGPGEVEAAYATAPAMLGPWTARGVLSASAPEPYCTGQPRTVFVLPGLGGWEWVDEWTGGRNETHAKVLLEPMSASPWSCSAAPATPGYSSATIDPTRSPSAGSRRVSRRA